MKHDTNFFFFNIFVQNFNTQKAKLQTCVMHRDKNWREWHLFLTSYDIVATQMTHTYHISRITLNDPWFIVSNWIKYNVFVLYSKNDSSLKPQVMHNHKNILAHIALWRNYFEQNLIILIQFECQHIFELSTRWN